MTSLKKKGEKAEELNKKVQLVNDQLVGWTNRIAQKIDQQFQENITGQFGNAEGNKENYSKQLANIFEKLANAVVKQVQQNVMDSDDFGYEANSGDCQEGEGRPVINLTAFLNDFGNQDFLDKNVRVRPVSGQTRAGAGGDLDETKTQLDGAKDGKSLMMGGDGGDDEEKFNRMINLDMEE